ncbi:MAG: hypothetical protein PUG67_07385 [Peptoniphilaceae bacterium]|nr:hypothetical protein [Peptoniphilaceae bacterium]
MRKKGFISIYVLFLLLILSLSLTFLYEQNKNDYDFSVDFYDKKQAIYASESVLNLANKNFDSFRDQTIKEIKDYYYSYIVKRMDKGKIDVKKTYKISYDNKTYEPKFVYIEKDKIIRLISQAKIGNCKAESRMDYQLKPKFDFNSKKTIFYDFREDLNFKSNNLKEETDHIDLETKGEKFYKINGDFTVKNLEEDKEDTSDEKENDQETKDEKVAKYEGILYINGDLTLETELDFKGLLIVNGQIKVLEKDENNNPTLKVDGQFIGNSKDKPDFLDFTYNKESFKYILDIDNLFDTELISKKVY